jgi:hypothetical protein
MVLRGTGELGIVTRTHSEFGFVFENGGGMVQIVGSSCIGIRFLLCLQTSGGISAVTSKSSDVGEHEFLLIRVLGN